jgi:hypothetical protein
VIAVGIPVESEEEVMAVIVAEGGETLDPRAADRVADAAHAVLRSAAVRAHRRRDPEDRDQQAAQISVQRGGVDAGHVGPRRGGDRAEERKIVS